MCILVCLYLVCVCVECTIHRLPHSIKLHPKGMEVVANVSETCDKQAGQKLLLKGSHVHMDILMNYLKDLEKIQGEKCNKSRINSETPRQEGAEVQS